jgi:hypothetical protein
MGEQFLDGKDQISRKRQEASRALERNHASEANVELESKGPAANSRQCA